MRMTEDPPGSGRYTITYSYNSRGMVQTFAVVQDEAVLAIMRRWLNFCAQQPHGRQATLLTNLLAPLIISGAIKVRGCSCLLGLLHLVLVAAYSSTVLVQHPMYCTLKPPVACHRHNHVLKLPQSAPAAFELANSFLAPKLDRLTPMLCAGGQVVLLEHAAAGGSSTAPSLRRRKAERGTGHDSQHGRHCGGESSCPQPYLPVCNFCIAAIP